MNKRQRKKRDKRVLRDGPFVWWQTPWIEYGNIQDFARDFNSITVSVVQDPNSWLDDSTTWTIKGYDISPSRQSNEIYAHGTGRGFGRCFSGDQSRRDRFPSPYLPDGSENPGYTLLDCCFDRTPLDVMQESRHQCYGGLSLASLMEEIEWHDCQA